MGAGAGGAAPRAPSRSSDAQQEIAFLLLLPPVAATLLPDPLALKGDAEEEEEAAELRSCTADGGRGDAALIISRARLLRFSLALSHPDTHTHTRESSVVEQDVAGLEIAV